MPRVILLLLLPVLLASCQEKSAPSSTPVSGIIEVLRHDEGTFALGERIPLGAVDSTFEVDGLAFTVTSRWAHAETTRETTDDAEGENHAVEVSWQVDGDDQSQWIYQSESEDSVSTLEPLGLRIRVTPPGARPPRPDDSSFAGQVQFLWKGCHHDLPGGGGEVFDGWKIRSIKSYEHALLDDEGGVTESADAGFANRVLEVHLTSDKGSEERHIAFLDHPEITRGIHPTILPVSRIGGDEASNSRLVVCAAMEPAAEQHLVHLSPGPTDQELTVRLWLNGASEFKTITVRELPAEIPLPEGQPLLLKRQFSHANPHVKWERCDPPQDGKSKPAVVIEHRASHHQKSEFVLLLDEVTPCRIKGKHLMLRYSSGE